MEQNQLYPHFLQGKSFYTVGHMLAFFYWEF